MCQLCCALIPQNTSLADRKRTHLFCKHFHRTADTQLENNLNKRHEAWLRHLCVVPLASLLFFCMYGESGMRCLSDFAHCGRRQAALGASQLTAVSKPNTPSSRFEQKKVQYFVVHASRNDAYPMTRHAVRRDLQLPEELVPVHPHRDASSLQ